MAQFEEITDGSVKKGISNIESYPGKKTKSQIQVLRKPRKNYQMSHRWNRSVLSSVRR